MRPSVGDDAGAQPEDAATARSATALRFHLQGTFLLVLLLLAIWGMLRWAGPVIDGTLRSPDGAIVAQARAEPDESADGDRGPDSEQDQPLDSDEVASLQAALARFSYDPGPVDGIMGELTSAAADAAKSDLGLAAASDRRLLDTLAAAIEALGGATGDLGSSTADAES